MVQIPENGDVPGVSFKRPVKVSGCGAGYLTAKQIIRPTCWSTGKGEEEPWCLATNLPDREMALRYYRRRMWIEEMFGDLKKHGFDLESYMLHDFLHSRLTLAVAFLYVWLISVGGRTIHSGLRHLVDRNDRRDLSIFQIGLRYIQRRMTNAFLSTSPLHLLMTPKCQVASPFPLFLL